MTYDILTARLEMAVEIERLLGVYELPTADGDYHRFDDPNGRPGNYACWYRLCPIGMPTGSFGNFRTGQSYNWQGGVVREASDFNLERLQRRSEQAAAKFQDQKQRAQSHAEVSARNRWKAANSANPKHPYLESKQVQPHRLRQKHGLLLVPIHLVSGRIVNVQTIDADGTKRFAKGGRIKGCCYQFGKVTGQGAAYLCEGWATGATLFEETCTPTFCAFNCHNLLEVGRAVFAAYPKIQLIVAGDDDRMTAGNPGRKYALEVASMLGAQVAFPRWPSCSPLSLSDFNDLAVWKNRHGK